MEQQEGEQVVATAQLLPDDVLADVLGRLPPRSLAACRGACRAWCDVVDARRLLPRADLLLPHKLGGIFCNMGDMQWSELLAHPSVRHTVSGFLDDCTPYSTEVHDHCNGLLLLDGFVANPATRQCAGLPPEPARSYRSSHLVFDPAVSPHYEVLSIPGCYSYWMDRGVDDASPYQLLVFSSRTWQWEEASFLHEGEATTRAAQPVWCHEQRYGVYWQEALYAHWHKDCITRISLPTKKYRYIQLPNVELGAVYLGKSKEGVYCACVDKGCHIRVWLLRDQMMEWVLKHDSYLEHTLPRVDYYNQIFEDDEKFDGPWTLQEETYDEEDDESVDVFEWDSDNDDIAQTDDSPRLGGFRILGFHPYKEVLFLEAGTGKAVAYHWNTSKYQYLGRLYTEFYRKSTDQHSITSSFPYTPCWIDLFHGKDY